MVLKFWSKSINSFLLPFGHVSIILRDVTILKKLLLQGVDVMCLFDAQDPSILSIEVSSTTQTSYSSAILKWHDTIRTPSTESMLSFFGFLCADM